jgi:hypothetical protein
MASRRRVAVGAPRPIGEALMTSMPRRFLLRLGRILAAAALALTALALASLAGPVSAQESEADPPGRVARLSDLEGQVWLYSPDGGEWISATRNRPMTSGDRIATDAGARAELQIGSTTLRLDGQTELEIVRLDDEQAALALHDGSAIVRVRDLAGAGQLELSTDEGRFIALRAGTYRLDRANGRSDLTVYSGEARYEGPNSGMPVSAGQRAEFWIDSGGVAQYSLTAPVNDAFAAWSSERDRRVVGSIAERYVSPEMTGAAELDAYGRWEQTPDYGSVWYPTAVSADWAPYSHGHWIWVRPWGWTWVDDAPWGFAPFHYGRWVYLRSRWCWTPGTRVHRPVYAPALVAWVGGPRVGISVTIGSGPAVGWFPLAPREVYVPSYRVSPRYARNVNITNVTNVTVINNTFANPQAPRTFENRRAPRAITVVPSNVLAERRPVAPAAAQLRQAPWVRELATQPTRTAALVAPPVAAPPAPARSPDPRAVRPPPGGRPDAGDRPGLAGRPGVGPRDRIEADRDRDRRPPATREADPRVGTGAAQRSPMAPAQQPQTSPTAGPQPAPALTPPANNQPPTASERPSGRFEPGQRRSDTTPPPPGRMPRENAPDAAPRAPTAAAPAAPAPTPTQRPLATPPPQAQDEGPTMRARPIQRGEERERRSEERRSVPPPPSRAEAPPPIVEARPAPQPQPQRVERATPPPVIERAAPTPPPQRIEPQQPPRIERPAPTPIERPAPTPPPPRIERTAPAPQQPMRIERPEPPQPQQRIERAAPPPRPVEAPAPRAIETPRPVAPPVQVAPPVAPRAEPPRAQAPRPQPRGDEAGRDPRDPRDQKK